MITQEEIGQGFADAGWEVDDSFSGHLLIGNSGDLSILAQEWVWQIDDPAYELYDVERNVTCWVRVVPTPRQAAMLLEEHGRKPEEERSNPANVK